MVLGPAPLFRDTAYVNGLVNVRDQWQPIAIRWEEYLSRRRQRLVTTEFVLIEIADGLAAVRLRTQAVSVVVGLRANPLVEIVPFTSGLFTATLDLYRNAASRLNSGLAKHVRGVAERADGD